MLRKGNNMRHTLLVCTTAALLAGCMPRITDAPANARVDTPEQWRTPFAATTADAHQPLWRTAFGDPRLAELVEQALRNNPDIQIAMVHVAEARAQESVARALLLPSVDVSVPAARSRALGATGQAMLATSTQPVFQASYEVDLFGRNAAQIEAAQANTAAAEASQRAAQLAVASATATSFISLLALDSRLALLRSTVATREDDVRIARRREKTGYASQMEVRQAEAELHATAQQIPVAEKAIAQQENALSVLVGMAPAEIARSSRFAALHPPTVPQSLPSALAANRPDIALAAHNLAATSANLRIAQRQFLPQITLNASLGAVASTALHSPVHIWSLGGSVLAPLFSGGRLDAQFGAATAQRDQAAFTYQRAVLTGFREVEDQLVNLDRLRLQATELTQQETAVTALLRHASNRYRAGYAAYLDQVDAQRSLLAVQLTLLQTKADRLTASVALYQALGSTP